MNKKKILIMSICFSILCIVCVFSCIAFGKTSKSDFSNDKLFIQEYQSQGIKLSAKKLASNSLEGGYVVSAIVTPADNDTNLIWEINWKDSSVEDELTDFLFYVVSDDTRSIRLAKRKDFDNQIYLKVYSSYNKDRFAICIIDCMIYVKENKFHDNGIFVELDDKSIELDDMHQDLIINNDNSISFASLPSISFERISVGVSYDADFTEQLYYGFDFGGTTKVINHGGDSSNSSYAHDFTFDIKFYFSDSVKQILTSLGYHCKDFDVVANGGFDNTILGWFDELLDESIDESDLYNIVPNLKDVKCWFVLDLNINFVDVKNSNEEIGGLNVKSKCENL